MILLLRLRYPIIIVIIPSKILKWVKSSHKTVNIDILPKPKLNSVCLDTLKDTPLKTFPTSTR